MYLTNSNGISIITLSNTNHFTNDLINSSPESEEFAYTGTEKENIVKKIIKTMKNFNITPHFTPR